MGGPERAIIDRLLRFRPTTALRYRWSVLESSLRRKTRDKDFHANRCRVTWGTTMPKRPPFPESDHDGDRSASNIGDIIGRVPREPTRRSGK